MKKEMSYFNSNQASQKDIQSCQEEYNEKYYSALDFFIQNNIETMKEVFSKLFPIHYIYIHTNYFGLWPSDKNQHFYISSNSDNISIIHSNQPSKFILNKQEHNIDASYMVTLEDLILQLLGNGAFQPFQIFEIQPNTFEIYYNCYKPKQNNSAQQKERNKLTAGLRYDILRRDGFKCQICGRTAQDGVKLHVDHIIPISKGGKTEWNNLRTLCQECNLGKNDKIE